MDVRLPFLKAAGLANVLVLVQAGTDGVCSNAAGSNVLGRCRAISIESYLFRIVGSLCPMTNCLKRIVRGLRMEYIIPHLFSHQRTSYGP
jgi:hypothetical protein